MVGCQKHNSQIHSLLAQVLALTGGSISIYQLIVSAKVFLITLRYSKVILKGEISMAQLLTLEFMVFLVRNFFKGK